MGIKQLTKVIKEHAPSAIRQRSIAYYSDKIIAIDASLTIYQFLIAVRSEGNALSNADSTTSHIVGLFYRTIRMVNAGIRPLYVFDGLPPALKLHELTKRLEKREAAIKEYEIALEKGDKTLMEKYDKRKTKITKKHTDDAMKLLDLMGIPYMVAPCEAEAYCAALCKAGVVDAVATEDMDALTFGTSLLLRNMNASESKKLPIYEYKLQQILQDLDLSMDQFIDMCILLGCDYCQTIKGIGPKKAYAYIKQHKSIEKILDNEKSFHVEKDWNYLDARKVFVDLPKLEDNFSDFVYKFEPIKIDELTEFLVVENNFNADRVKNGLQRLKTVKKQDKQLKIDHFFKKK